MKIAIEGMDGVGKTTIAKMVANSNNMIYVEKPLTNLFETEDKDGKKILAKVSEKIYEFDDEAIKAWFFGMGNIYTFLKYKESDLIIDRHFASNYFWNGTKRTDIIFKTMIELIGNPDITIILYASVKTRMHRLYKRNPNDYDLTDKEKHVIGYDKMIKFLSDYNIPFIVVDTEGKNEEAVYNEVNEIIKNLKNKQNTKKLVKA